jgi:hypothetical protein
MKHRLLVLLAWTLAISLIGISVTHALPRTLDRLAGGTPPDSVVPGGNPVPGTVIQVPVIQAGGGWKTIVQVQNVGVTDTQAMIVLWGPYSGFCPPQCTPLKFELTGLLHPGASWPWEFFQPLGGCDGTIFQPSSGIVYAIKPGHEPLLCAPNWRPSAEDVGEPLAVDVQRIQTGATGEPPKSGSYTAISLEMEGARDPRTGALQYYAPLVFDQYSPVGWNSTLWVQNSGDECTSLEIWYQPQQRCLQAAVESILALCPGETIKLDSRPASLGHGWAGSAWIRASQPLGIIVDEWDTARAMLLSYRGVPADFYNPESQTITSYGSLFGYAPLLYREFNGWNAGIQVQNLSSVHNAMVKVEFLDQSGGIIDSLVEWICPRGSQRFYLPAIDRLAGPGGRPYVGWARIESQHWWGPGDPDVDAPFVLAIVDLTNYSTGQGLAYNAFPRPPAKVKFVALPSLRKGRVDPFGPTGATWTSEIAVTDLDPTPSVVTFRIGFYDQNGLLYSICQTFSENQVDYLDLRQMGIIQVGWQGSALIDLVCSQPANAGSLGVIAVERATGYPSGDLTSGYDAFPLATEPIHAGEAPCTACP